MLCGLRDDCVLCACLILFHIANDISDETFFSLNTTQLQKILSSFPEIMIDFICKYSFEKGTMAQNANDDSLVSVMEVEDVNNALNVTEESEHDNSDKPEKSMSEDEAPGDYFCISIHVNEVKYYV